MIREIIEEAVYAYDDKGISPEESINTAELAIKEEILAKIMEKMPKKKEHITVGGLNSSDLADRINREIDIRNRALSEAIKVIEEVLK